MNLDKQKLTRLGWHSHEIAHTTTLVRSIEQANHTLNRRHHHFTHVLATAVAIVGNWFIALMLIPVFSTLTYTALLSVASIIGILFGWIMGVIVKDLEKLTSMRQQLTALGTGIVAGIVVSFVVHFSNTIALTAHTPALVGIVYGISFATPYIIILRSNHAE